MSKILYMSCHEILEYDEVKLFAELGHEVYSLGAYTQPGGDSHRKRPSLDLPYDPHFIELALQYPAERLHPEQLAGVDIAIIMHKPELLKHNWPLFKSELIDKGKRVIWRSIGQSIPRVEDKLRPMRNEGLEIVRYSPTEDTIEGNVGSDAMIRFYKDPEEYNGWTGSDRRVVNFTQSMKQRRDHCGYDIWSQTTQVLPRVVYGPGNEDLGKSWGGMLTYEEQMRAFRAGRVYFYHGTYPASYTLSFIEAMMTGMPIVAVGPIHGNGSMFNRQQTYEIPDFIDTGLNGYCGDNAGYLTSAMQEMLIDHDKAAAIGQFGRARAIELFGKAKIKSEWENYLK